MWEALVLGWAIALDAPRVIDGDTLAAGGERIRIENVDAPERGGGARCAGEAHLAEAAAESAAQALERGERIVAISDGRRDRYGRLLARIEIDGADLGQRLIAEGVARPWRGRSSNFCVAPGH